MDFDGKASYRLSFSTTEVGYYLTMSEDRGNIPGYLIEWYKLKSCINGLRPMIETVCPKVF